MVDNDHICLSHFYTKILAATMSKSGFRESSSFYHDRYLFLLLKKTLSTIWRAPPKGEAPFWLEKQFCEGLRD